MRQFSARLFGARLFTPRLFGRLSSSGGATDAVRITFRIDPDLGTDILEVSGLDDLWMRATVMSAATGVALQTGTVALHFCHPKTTTLIDPSAVIDFTAEGGWWTATCDDATLTSAFTAANLAPGSQFDMVLVVPNRARRRVRKCRYVAVADA